MAQIVLLRGVNVGGNRTFSPKKLAERLRHLDVVNIGAAGTFVVRKAASQADVRKAFEKELPFETKIVICRGRDIEDMLANDPFADEEQGENIVGFVSFLGKNPRMEPNYPLLLPPRGAWLVKLIGRRRRFVFGMYRRHMKTIRHLGTTDDLFDVPVTTRNWNTIRTIAKAVGIRSETR